MAFGEDIEYCDGCGSILEGSSCQNCDTLTPEEEYEKEQEEED